MWYLSEQDQKCLKCFFDSKEFNKGIAEFFKLFGRPLSTNEIKTELHEYANRTKRRLERLERFGFIRRKEKKIVPEQIVFGIQDTLLCILF